MAAPPPYPGTPRWVKVSGIIGIVAILLFGIMALAGGGPGGGGHGPGRHMPSNEAPPASVSEDSTPLGGLGRHTPSREYGVQQP